MRSRPDVSTATASIVHGEALDVLSGLPDGCAGLVYVDPPFNTGGVRTGLRTTATEDAAASRLGFAGRHYRVERHTGARYDDRFDDYLGWLRPRLVATRRILAPSGSLYFHIDPRESHYCKVLLDEIFGRDCFLNEVVWAYDYGARATRRWPAKHGVSRTWRHGCRHRSGPHEGSCRRTSGGTRSSRRRRASEPGIRPRSRSASCAGSSPPHRVRATWSWTGAPAAEPPVRPLRSW